MNLTSSTIGMGCCKPVVNQYAIVFLHDRSGHGQTASACRVDLFRGILELHFPGNDRDVGLVIATRCQLTQGDGASLSQALSLRG